MILALVSALALAAPSQPGSEDYALPAVDAEPWRPALASGRFLATEEVRVDSPFTGRVDARWAHRPLVYRTAEDEVIGVIDDAVALDLAATLGLGPLRLGAWAPVYIATRSEVMDDTSAALGDARLQALYALHEGAELGVGLRLAIGLPLGGAGRALGSDDMSGELTVVADADAGPVRLAGELGWVARPGVALTEDELSAGSLDLRLGAAWQAWEHTSLVAEVIAGWTPGLAGYNAFPVEILLGTSRRNPTGHTLRGGVSIALTPAVGVPSFRLVLGVGHLPHLPEEESPLDGD